MDDAHPVSVPLDPHINLHQYTLDDEVRKLMKKRSYPQLIGSLMYAAIGTRPDIAFAVSTLAQFMSDPAPVHWEAAKRVLRYLKGTRTLGITYGPSSDGLVAYSDADWATQAHRHSISGNVFLFNGGAIGWSSRKQPVVALSSTEAEFISSSDSSREATWLRAFLFELFPNSPNLPIPFYLDNQSALKLIQTGMLNARTKHIDVRYRYICEAHTAGIIKVDYCPTNEMPADAMTKALARPRLEALRVLIGMVTA